MDDFEKLALRRRKPLFAETLHIGKEFLQDLYGRGLLNEDGLEQIKAEKHVGQRAAKLVDWLLECKSENAFLDVCQALVGKYPDITKEMQTEVRIERGDVEIDDDVMKEAGVLVHRKFGTSRRFAETDKKDMTDLIAIKIQLAKEEWRQEMEQVRQELQRYIDICKKKDSSVAKIDELIVRFMRKHEAGLVSKAHDMTSTTDIIMSSVDDNDYIGKLKERVVFVLSRAERVIEERDLITGEREKLQKSLDVSNEALKADAGGTVDTLPQQVERYKKELGIKDGIINRLRKMNDGYELEVEEKERELKIAREESQNQKDKIAELELQIKGTDEERKVSDEAASHSAEKKSVIIKPFNSVSVKGTGSIKQTSTSSIKRGGNARK